jgi:hypothetical protein
MYLFHGVFPRVLLVVSCARDGVVAFVAVSDPFTKCLVNVDVGEYKDSTRNGVVAERLFKGIDPPSAAVY